MTVKALKSGDVQSIEKTKSTAVEQLVEAAGEYIDAAKSNATKKAYSSDLQCFSDFCALHHFEELPALPATVALYITELAEKGKAPSTISRRLTAISQAHKFARLQSPTTSPEVIEVNKGIRRKKGVAQRQAKPLVLSQLKKVLDAIRCSFLGRRDKAILLVGWAGALRRSEVVSLDCDDVSFVEEGMVVRISRSKTDQEGEGYKIGVPFGRDEKYCPVKRLQHWIDLAKIENGPLFFGIGTPGKKFHADVEHKRLSAQAINRIICKRMKDAGMSSKGYSGHSLRAGFVTSAAAAQIPEHMIQHHTRHRSAKVLRGYIREGGLFVQNSLSTLL